MDNQNQNTNVIFPAGDQSSQQSSVGLGQSLAQPQSLEPAQLITPQPLQADITKPEKEKLAVRLVKRADVLLAILLVLGSLGLVLNSYLSKDKPTSNSAAERYETTQIPLSELVTSEGITFGTQSVAVNGRLQANDGLIISPTLQPTSAVAGQMYYDQTSNVLAYYDGTQFVQVGGGVQSVAGLTGQINVGNGISSAGGQLSNTGVLSVQGLTGNVSLTSGNGIGISGGTISNTGVVSVSSSSPSLVVTNDGNGNVTLDGSGAGTVSSPGGTIGRVPMFTAAQTIADSIITQSGMTVTVAGDLAVVTGGLTLSNALSVSNGGTGATSLALNGVLIGQGTGAITSVASGAPGLCFVSTAGAPTWSACPGGAGVDSLNGLTGALTIANASGAGSVITLDDASTVTKGIARFNATNFSAAGGVVNTVQNINTGASPTFAGVNTNSINPSGALTIGAPSQIVTLQGNGGTTITATNGANTTTVAFTAPSASATINFPALSAGTYDLCTTSGNCLGGGGGGANTALSNLTSVAINTTLLPGVAGGVNLGSATLPFGDLFLSGTSGTPGTNNFRITGVSTSGTRTITIPDASGTMCLTTGNCAGAGGGVTTSGGTIGTLPVFTAAQTLGDSLISQSGSGVTVDGNLNLIAGNQYRINGTQISSADLSNNANLAKLSVSQTFTGNSNAFQNGLDSTNAFNVQNAAGSRLLTVDTSNGEVELGTGSLIDGKLVFNNVSNTNTVTVAPGTPTGNRTVTLPDDSGIVCLNTGNCAGAGATLQTAYNFSVGGTTPKIKVNSTLGAVDIQDADSTIGANLFNVRASNGGGLGSVMLGVASTGAVTLQNASNSTNAFRVLSAGGTSVVTVDTTNGQTLLGQSSTLNGVLVFRNATNTNTVTLTTAAASTGQTITLPDATGEVCLNSGNCSGSGSTNTLQAAYDAGNTITTSTARNIAFSLADSATDANFLVDLQCDTSCATNGRFAIQDDGADVFTISPAGGSANFINAVNSTQAFNVENAAGANLLTADTTNGRIGINLGANNTPTLASGIGGAEINGALRISGVGSTTWDNYTTPVGSSVLSKVNIANQTMNPFGQIMALGLTSGSSDTARGLSVFDARTVAHQPSIAVFSPDENSMVGFSWNGSNSAATVQTNSQASGSTDSITVQSGNVTAGNGSSGEVIVSSGSIQGGTGGSTGLLTLQSGNGAGTNSSSGNILLDAGTATGSGTTGTITIGGTNASALTLGRTGLATNNAGTLTLGQLGTTDNVSYLCRNASNQLAACSGTATGAAFIQDGNTFGGVATLGTNDASSLSFETSGTSRATFGATGGLTLLSGNAMTVTSALTSLTGATSGDAFNVSNSTSTGNIALFKDNATNVVTIADGGITTFQPTSASAIAFRVLDTDGTTPLLGVDSSANYLFTDGNFSANLNAEIGQDLIVDDQAYFGGNSNSTEALVVYNTSNTLFQVDGQNSRVYIGNPTADTTGAFLVLDTKTTSGDPTGVLGAMYYNANFGTFRCFEQDVSTTGYWRDCLAHARTSFYYSNEFLTTSNDSNIKFASDNGGGFDDGRDPETGRPGIIRSGTGGGTNGWTYIGSNTNVATDIIFGNGNYWRYDTAITIPSSSALSSGTQRYTLRIGFIEDPTSDGADGCFFKYVDNVNSGNWQGVCRNNSTASTCDTTITVATDTWYRLTISANSAGSSVDFQINGVSKCQVTTNIPTTTDRATSWANAMYKDIGSTDRWIDQDFVEVQAQLGTAR